MGDGTERPAAPVEGGRKWWRRPAAALAAVVLGALGCTPNPPAVVVPEAGPSLVEVPVAAWPELVDDGERDDLVAACRGSAAYMAALPEERVFSFGTQQRTAAELAVGVAHFCDLVATGRPGLADRLAEDFVLLRSRGRDGAGDVLFTAYYEPLLEARRQREEDFSVPIYAVPDDLVTVDLSDFGVTAEPGRLVGRVAGRKLVPYWDREEIDYAGAIDGEAVPLAYLAGPVEAFFLHVQGSGTLRFPDGSSMRAGYAMGNGRRYHSIGKLLIDEGLVPAEDMSMQAIKAYLEAHPDEVRRVLSANPSYVFFRPLEESGGPLGCYEIPLTAARSIATDRRFLPAPVPAFVRTTLPTADGTGSVPFARFVLNQDTGGSIVGPGRVDLFLGLGPEAGAVAGRTKSHGELLVLLPRRR